MASRVVMPLFRSASRAKSIIMIAFFLHDADEQDDPDQRDRRSNPSRYSSSASSAPTPADGSVERMVIG